MNEVSHTELTPTVRTLPNGLRVVAECLPYVHSASVGLWIETGSANETYPQAGISHFLEHLFFKGTNTRTSREIMHAIESKGGHLNAFTTREHTCLYAKTLDRHVHTAIEILADILKHPTFFDLEKERNVIIEEIASSKDMPEELVHDLLTGQTWPDHPLGRPIAGFEETVEKMGLDEVREYKASRYRPENMCLAIVGNFDEEAFFSQVEDEFGVLAKGSANAKSDRPAFNSGLTFEDRAITQNHLTCAFPGSYILDPDRYTYDMLSSTLGGGSTSRLFESIREQAGLAYSIYAFNSMYQTTGMLGLYAAVAPENLSKALQLCSDEMRELQDTPVSEEELLSNREQLKGGLLLALEGTFSRMARMVRSLFLFDRVVPVEDVLAAVDGVTAEAMQKLAQDMFRKDRCAMAIVGPVSEAEMDLPS